MARNTSNATNYAEAVALIPMLKEAKNYEFWSLKMKTMFKSQELWDLLENGFQDNQTDEPDQRLRENRKKDAKALFLIQQALHDEIFPLIAAATTSTQAWDILKQEYLEDKKVTRKEIEEETSIDMVDSEAPKKKQVSGEQAAAEAKSTKDGKQGLEEAVLVMAALIITLTYEGLLNPPSTLFKDGTEIDWSCLSTTKQGFISGMKKCPAILAFMFLFLNTMLFLQALLLAILSLRGRYGVAAWFTTYPLILCYCVLLMAFSYYTAYVAFPLVAIVPLLGAAVMDREKLLQVFANDREKKSAK